MENKKALLIWLVSILVLVAGIVIIGGITRLTWSGLSMVDWNPLMGIIPPLSESGWLELFNRYQEFPEYLPAMLVYC